MPTPQMFPQGFNAKLPPPPFGMPPFMAPPFVPPFGLMPFPPGPLLNLGIDETKYFYTEVIIKLKFFF